MTRIELYLTKANPDDLSVDGAVLDVGGAVMQDHVKASLGDGDKLTLKSGLYTFMFSVPVPATLTIHVIDADTHASLQVAKPIDATLHRDSRTYSFVVP